jgi:hypothetical protein
MTEPQPPDDDDDLNRELRENPPPPDGVIPEGPGPIEVSYTDEDGVRRHDVVNWSRIHKQQENDD